MKKVHYLLFFISSLYFINVAFDRIKGNPRGVINSDCEGYYDYLPGLFIIKDFHKLPPGSMWPNYNDKHEFVDKYSCGVAYFELPFFGIGYLINKLKSSNSDEYLSPIYSKAIAFGGTLIALFALLTLFNALLMGGGGD